MSNGRACHSSALLKNLFKERTSVRNEKQYFKRETKKDEKNKFLKEPVSNKINLN